MNHLNATATHIQFAAAGLDWEDPLHADFGWVLGVVFRAYRAHANDVIADVPGGARGYHVLTAAARPLQQTQAAIAQELGIDRTVMTYLIDDLEAAGLVRRMQDPRDRRARLLEPTPEGERCMANVEQRLAGVERYLMQGLPEADQFALRCLLQRLARHIDTLEPAGDRCQVMTAIDTANS